MPRFSAIITTISLPFVPVALAAGNPLADRDDPVTAVAVATSPVPVSFSPELRLVGADGAQAARVDEAVDRFTTNGLSLPDLEIRFSADEDEGCRGHHGLFQLRHSPWRILVCSDLDFVITHELAHAWAAANLHEQNRARYVTARGLTNWDDRSRPWKERGEEDAAFIIQQNLMTERAPAGSATWDERIAAYELLTGRESPIRR